MTKSEGANFHGTTTLDRFSVELDATLRVAAWEYGGGQGRIKTRGTFKVQCCIHPWMRTTVTIHGAIGR